MNTFTMLTLTGILALTLFSCSDAILRCEICLPILNFGCCSNERRQCCPNKAGVCPANPVENFNVLVACGRSCSDDSGCPLQQKCCPLGSSARCCVNPLAQGLTRSETESKKS